MVQSTQTTVTAKNTHDSFRLRKMGLRDVFAMQQLFSRSIDDSFTYFPEEYRARLRREHNLARLTKAALSPKAHFVLLSDTLNDVGYCLVRFQRNKAYLLWMYVDPDYRGRGAGQGLLEAAIELSRAHNVVTLELVTHDKENFYEKHGFAVVKHVAGLVAGVDMVIMEYKL